MDFGTGLAPAAWSPVPEWQEIGGGAEGDSGRGMFGGKSFLREHFSKAKHVIDSVAPFVALWDKFHPFRERSCAKLAFADDFEITDGFSPEPST